MQRGRVCVRVWRKKSCNPVRFLELLCAPKKCFGGTSASPSSPCRAAGVDHQCELASTVRPGSIMLQQNFALICCFDQCYWLQPAMSVTPARWSNNPGFWPGPLIHVFSGLHCPTRETLHQSFYWALILSSFCVVGGENIFIIIFLFLWQMLPVAKITFLGCRSMNPNKKKKLKNTN